MSFTALRKIGSLAASDEQSGGAHSIFAPHHESSGTQHEQYAVT